MVSRAKSPANKSNSSETPGILPVPEAIVRHHGETLFGPMREWVETGRVPPVLLITGIEGVGKRSISYFLSQWLLCEKSGFGKAPSEDEGPGLFGELTGDAAPSPASTDPGPCGTCANCQRAVKGSWVDFAEITPEDDSSESVSTGALKIEQFRKLKSSIGFGAHEGSFKIVLIPNADRMTTQAANSVLKLLEEPPPGWIFFLTASDPTLMLPTVVSRCQRLRLRPFSHETLLELLDEAGVEESRAKICAELGQGSWSKALALAENETWEQRKLLFHFLKEPQTELNTLTDWAANQPSHFNLLLDQLENLALDLIRWSLGPSQSSPEHHLWLNADGRPALIAHAQAALRNLGGASAARTFWMARAERLAQARQEALAPLNRKLLVQDLLLPWLEATTRSRA